MNPYNNLTPYDVQMELSKSALAKIAVQTELDNLNEKIYLLKTSVGNHYYESLEDAVCNLEDFLCDQAVADCEGSHCCGDEKYEQVFRVGDKLYKAKLECEYNRHDKKYYYLEESEFSYDEILDVTNV